ncbi:MAG TPA: ubiquinone/menaquinone biosynthesis methyltransferase [Anaerolineales bacterium]|nr:ubiquinone/menaquinone biosynthesis methyltransferase [Anaerolineales bacterium]
MADLQGEARAAYVRRMFERIASRYDQLNRLMTAGQDRRWRGEVVRRAALQPGERVLDLGAGTGDLALEALRRVPAARVVGADFAQPMLGIASRRGANTGAAWILADALHLPFARATFDSLVSGFLLRNVSDLEAALEEQARVLKPSRGRMVCLDTTPPGPGPLRPLLEFHLRRVIPLLGRWVARDPEAYNYLPGSTQRFLTAEALAEQLQRHGFIGVGFVRRMFGTIAIHWGRRADRAPITGGA